ncbi:MAG: DNA mismatch repair protein [Ekhidna sp.]|nr:DNA mismatch repair protein [Ekhidna sp.]
MAFKVDSQTINDLKLIGARKGKDVFSLYNKTKTRGGAQVLKDMFLYPHSKKEEISARINIIKYFKNKAFEFPFDNSAFGAIEFYLSNNDERTKLNLHDDTLKRKINSLIGADATYQQLYRGILGTLDFLLDLNHFVNTIASDANDDLQSYLEHIKSILDNPKLHFLKETKSAKKLSYAQTVMYDHIFRFTVREEIQLLLRLVFDFDAFIALAQVAEKHNFAFAEVYDGEDNLFEMKGVYHPLVPNAVGNDVHVDEQSNMIFLTGANMAGKSTFMKTFSVAIYLAHMGFPIPAKSMRFSIQNGMFTTINLADNLSMGFSHFYAEVKRLKRVAESVNANERLVVVFDELFRGTNVKDAHEATVVVMSAFATKRKCTFVISTHIIEAGEELKKLKDNIKFLYLPTIMKGNIPQYTYKIEEGITSDRHGMVIIENENILEILRK